MTRRGLSKTRTIKERTAYIYLPSLEMLEDWKKRSQATKMSLSKFVIDRVEDSVRKDEGEDGYLGRIELLRRLRKVEDELKELTSENRMLKKLVDNQETDLKRYRSQPFSESDFEGIRRYDKELIELLKSGKSYSADEILARLNIEPSEVDLVKAINVQLETLEAYGLIDYSGRAWRWKA
jgi:hypothetical protein